MEAAAAADAGSATSPKRRVRVLKPLPVLSLEKERVDPRTSEEGAAQATVHAPAQAQVPVQASNELELKAERKKKAIREIVKFWRHAKQRRSVVKWINVPKKQELQRFLALTNATSGQWVPPSIHDPEVQCVCVCVWCSWCREREFRFITPRAASNKQPLSKHRLMAPIVPWTSQSQSRQARVYVFARAL